MIRKQIRERLSEIGQCPVCRFLGYTCSEHHKELVALVTDPRRFPSVRGCIPLEPAGAKTYKFRPPKKNER